MGLTPAHASLPKPEIDPPPASSPKKSAKSKKRKVKAKASPSKDAARIEKLVIVESPAKAKTLGRYLGQGFKVKASIGHVRDLLRSRLSVDVENDFAPHYTIPKEKRSVVKELKEATKKAKSIYLATDPDREGEAIAWHLTQAVDFGDRPVHRVAFYEITPSAVKAAFQEPRPIDQRLVEAQTARRVLDRLVGYKLSPLLWSKVKHRLSAGRVQSVALRLVVEREREIQGFVPQEFWTIDAQLSALNAKESFLARLIEIKGEKVVIPHNEEAQKIVKALTNSTFIVDKVTEGEKRRRPAAPFTTSTLQQEASRRLRFSARRTMRIAQDLYEGIELGAEGRIGLITYMRTDSTQVAAYAQAEARKYIAAELGQVYLPKYPPRYQARTPRAQEAHEAIRPTSVFRTPDNV
ncbi:MAG: type I DNA topoisomerase, partial [Chloroflexi bacterium]|nr:type I DNA topoisomerase [Chloroflexota bacterium]